MIQIASFLRVSFLIAIPFVTATNISLDDIGFRKSECYARTLEFIDNRMLAWDDEVFFRDSAGQPMSHPDNLTLTLAGCEKLCGPKQRWYWDIGPRLSIWLIPILLLLSNVELSPLDKRRFLAILHLLGDPIDSIWSLVHKIDSWDRCYRLTTRYDGLCWRCKRVIATVFAGFEEIEGPRIKSETYFNALAYERGLATQFPEWRRTAVELADSRTDELYRTCFAILLYIFQLVAGFVKEVGGGNNSSPNGRIATGAFLSWLVPTVLLSNAVGGFPSRRTGWDIIERFAERTGKPLYIPHSESILLSARSSFSRTSSTGFFDSLGWSGGIHTFRPWKFQYVTYEHRWPRTALVVFLSMSPLWIGMIGAFIILWYGVTIGLNCRHMWLMGSFLAWSVSPLITWLSYSSNFATGKYHWRFVLVKDALIALPIMTIIILSACGMFNVCYCWSGFLYHPGSAHVPLKGDPIYELNNRTIYPTVVGACISLQLLVLAVIAMIWRRGLKLLRWSEWERSQEWERATGYKLCNCMYSRRSSEADSSLSEGSIQKVR